MGQAKVRVTLYEYLDELVLLTEAKSSEDRMSVPTLYDIAEATGIHIIVLDNMANNQKDRVRLSDLGKILRFLRQIGYEARVDDILEYQD